MNTFFFRALARCRALSSRVPNDPEAGSRDRLVTATCRGTICAGYHVTSVCSVDVYSAVDAHRAAGLLRERKQSAR